MANNIATVINSKRIIAPIDYKGVDHEIKVEYDTYFAPQDYKRYTFKNIYDREGDYRHTPESLKVFESTTQRYQHNASYLPQMLNRNTKFGRDAYPNSWALQPWAKIYSYARHHDNNAPPVNDYNCVPKISFDQEFKDSLKKYNVGYNDTWPAPDAYLKHLYPQEYYKDFDSSVNAGNVKPFQKATNECFWKYLN